MITTVGRFEIDDDPRGSTATRSWRFLSTEAYWGRTRSRADLETQLDEAWRLVAAYDGDGATVGFARAVSDGVNFAYLADVYVEAVARGAGSARRSCGRWSRTAGPRLPLDALHERRARPVRALRLRGAPDATAMVRPAAPREQIARIALSGV
jgi:hypothetical protein